MKGKPPALAIVIGKGAGPKKALKGKDAPKDNLKETDEGKEPGVGFRDAASEVFTKIKKGDRDGFISSLRSLIDIRMMED